MTATKLFIVGVGRSGTSLLQAMLGSHSQIGFLPETGFFRRYILKSELKLVFQTYGIQGVVDTLKMDERISRLDLNLDCIKSLPSLTGDSVSIAIYNWFLEAVNLKYSGDKDPRNIESIDVMLRLWPDSKIIHIFRDPRDVLASKKIAEWSKNKSLFFHLVANVAQFSLGVHHQRICSDKSIKMLRYEDLLSDPEECLHAICDWLGIEFETEMLDFGKTAKALTASTELQWKSETLGPLLEKNSGKWRSQLNSREVAATQMSCRRVMMAGSYEPVEVRWVDRILSWPVSVCARITASFYKHRRLTKNKKVYPDQIA